MSKTTLGQRPSEPDTMYDAADKATTALNDQMLKFRGYGKGSVPTSMIEDDKSGESLGHPESNNYGDFAQGSPT